MARAAAAAGALGHGGQVRECARAARGGRCVKSVPRLRRALGGVMGVSRSGICVCSVLKCGRAVRDVREGRDVYLTCVMWCVCIACALMWHMPSGVYVARGRCGLS